VISGYRIAGSILRPKCNLSFAGVLAGTKWSFPEPLDNT